MSGMMKLRSYKTVVLMFAKYSHRLTGFDLVKKIARNYRHANEHKVSLMLQDLEVLCHNKEGIEYDWDRVTELLEMVENQ